MGLLFVERLEGEGVFRCRRCRVDAASKDAIISRDFYGCTGRAYLFDHVVVALKELVRMVALAPQLRETLLAGLLNECLMERRKGDVLLHHCFMFLPYEDCKIIIRVAIASIDEMISSPIGCRCLGVCLSNARDGELQTLEENIARRAIAIATDQCGAKFLQHALRFGSEELKVRIEERVAQNMVDLSGHSLGNYAVEACFRLTGSDEALRCVLSAFLLLSPGELEALVRGPHSNCVLAKLLDTGKRYSPSLAEVLAKRIDALPVAARQDEHARVLMWVIHRLFHTSTSSRSPSNRQ